jgi:hypothetical protein
MKLKTILIGIASIISVVLLVLIVVNQINVRHNISNASDDGNPKTDLNPSGIVLKRLDYPSDTTIHISLNNKLPLLNARIQLRLDTTSDQHLLIYKLDFTKQAQDSVFQSVIDTSQTTMVTDVEFNDYNFDGFLDFMLITEIDGAGNPSRHFWIYDSNLNKFVFDNALSEQFVGEMVYNFSSKTIETGYRIGMGGGSDVFKFIDGKLTLVERSREEEVVLNDTVKTKTTVEKLIDGQMKVVEETYENK